MDLTLQVEKLRDVAAFIVINLPAGTIELAFIHDAVTAFRSLGYCITTFFSINRQMDSVNLLGKSLDDGMLSASDECIFVKNSNAGLVDEFNRFDESKQKQKLLEQGGNIIYIRELFYYSADLCLLEKQNNFSEVLKDTIPLAYR